MQTPQFTDYLVIGLGALILLAGVGVGVGLGWWLMGRKMIRSVENAVEDRARVLREAEVVIHRIERLPAEADADAPDALDFYRVEATLTPLRGESERDAWAPGDLMLIEESDRSDDEPAVGVIRELAVADAEGTPAEQGASCIGERRLSFEVGAPDRVRRLNFRYYTVTFGRLNLPR